MLQAGDVLQERYRIVALLGKGGMGAVYRAWDTRLKVHVAVKEMIPQPGLDEETLAQMRLQFHQEATVVARLKHACLVNVTDFFEQGGNAYLVMTFVEGENLAARIQQFGALPETEVVALAQQLLDALAYCHDQGIIHRDIKPQNVIIRPDGRPVLVDFGLVKLWDPSDPRTRTAMRGMGTPEYAPPEQYEVAASHTDPRSDIYSLGATLYHALTGQAPPTATLRIASPDAFRPPRLLNPNVTPNTEAVILRATELSLNRRFSSAREMAAALAGLTPAYAPAPAATTGPWMAGQPAGTLPQAAAWGPPAATQPPAGRRTAMPDQPAAGRKRTGLWIGLGVGALVLIGLCAAAVGGALALPGVFGFPTRAPTAPPSVTTAADSEAAPTTAPPEVSPTVERVTPPSATTAAPVTDTPTEPPPVDTSLRWHSIGQSVKGQAIDVASIGDPRGMAIVVIGAIQGDQANTYMLVANLIEDFEPLQGSLPPGTSFHFIPTINPDGSATGTRRNAHDVDLNRNWDTYDWTPDPEQPGGVVKGAGGPKPLSEPETRSLAEYLLGLKQQGGLVRVVLWHSSQRLTSGGQVYPGYTSGGMDPASLKLADVYAGVTGYEVRQDWIPYETTGELICWCAEHGIEAIDIVIPRSLDGTDRALRKKTLDALLQIAQVR